MPESCLPRCLVDQKWSSHTLVGDPGDVRTLCLLCQASAGILEPGVGATSWSLRPQGEATGDGDGEGNKKSRETRDGMEE